jgi:hypothetical protein
LRFAGLRLAGVVDVFAAPAPVLALFALERFAGALRAGEVRVAPALADFALDVRLAVARFAVDLRLPVERLAAVLRAGFETLLELELPELLDVLAEPSTLHLPDINRSAASATASAISEPSFAALAATLFAACWAVSAASSPASRIFLRAAGLAAIAAAAAVSPAASISLLIAALASLSTVLLPEREFDEDELERDFLALEREELLRADFAIFYLPPSGKRHSNAVPVPE